LPDVSKRENLAAEPTTQKRLATAMFYGFIAVLAYLSYLIFEPFLVRIRK